MKEINIYDNALDTDLCDELHNRVVDFVSRKPEQCLFTDLPSSVEGKAKYTLIDGERIRAYFPELVLWNFGVAMWASSLCQRRVVSSPYLKSSLNIKYYDGENYCSQGLHYDTCPLTLILYLSDVNAPTVFSPTGRSPIEVKCVKGRVLLFDGREIPHQVRPTHEKRMTVVSNLYYPNDFERPEWVDEEYILVK